ncbi:MAG: MlaD family protein [Segniliparus sp.]|uniref:MlaD family protein n=1 Tax=Segniliparus sp. TaxID=2804064 RepID=UPI003F3035E0
MAVYQDLSGRAASVRALFLRGVATLVVLAVAGIFLYRTATGTYKDTFKLTLLTNSIGEGLVTGSEVKYHGYSIGSVETLEPLGGGKQKMTLVLDTPQASSLTADTTAKFIPANSFGTTAVELVSDGRGQRLVSGAVLRIDKQTVATSLTGLLRKANGFSKSIDQSALEEALTVLRKHADLVGPVSQAVVDTAKIVTILARNQRLSQSMSVAATVLNGVTSILPVIAGADPAMKSFAQTLSPDIAESGNTQFGYFADWFAELDNDFARNMDWVSPLANGLVNILAPASYAAGSIAPEFSRLPSLIDRTGEVIRKAHGGQVNLDVTLDEMPGLRNAMGGGQPQAREPHERAAKQSATQLPNTGADDGSDSEADGGGR